MSAVDNIVTVGTYYLKSRKPLADLPFPVTDQIGAVIARQVELHGEDKPFRIKALGYDWQFVPQAQVSTEDNKAGRVIRVVE